MAKKKSWSELSPNAKRAIVIGGIIEAALTSAAVKDLKSRPRSTVRGPKLLWLLANVVQPFGPIAYFAFGRKNRVELAKSN